MEVSVAGNGSEAWEMFQSKEFHFVLTDWNMPEINGLELVRKIREHSGAYVYVLLLTSRSEKTDLVLGLEAGADDFLSKPFDRNELRARLRAGERIINLQRQLEERNGRLSKANERMEKDLAAAARLQHSLLPVKLPETTAAKFAWSFRPCDELAGDNLNVFQLDENSIGIYVADVSGHGIAAALLSVTISQLLSPQRSQHGLLVQPDRKDTSKTQISSPLMVAQELNRRFPMEDFDGNYFTIIYGVLDVRTCELRYVSAGHPPMIIVSSDGNHLKIEKSGFPIGWLVDCDYEEHSLQLKPGDRLCLYSDGVADAENFENEKFGDSRLVESLSSSVSLSIDESVNEAMLKIETWCGKNELKDDMSMLAIEITN